MRLVYGSVWADLLLLFTVAGYGCVYVVHSPAI